MLALHPAREGVDASNASKPSPVGYGQVALTTSVLA
jgi:hypothetical protein